MLSVLVAIGVEVKLSPKPEQSSKKMLEDILVLKQIGYWLSVKTQEKQASGKWDM